MTLVVATKTLDGGVWMAADRIQGGFHYVELAQPKIYRITGDDDGFTFLAGFAGSPRVAQEFLRLVPPERTNGALEAWMTCLVDTVHARCADLGLVGKPDDVTEELMLAGETNILIAAEGRVFIIAENLAWTEPAEGWIAMGGAANTFAGAFEILTDEGLPADHAARSAWPFVQRHHRIGDLADELTLEAEHA